MAPVIELPGAAPAPVQQAPRGKLPKEVPTISPNSRLRDTLRERRHRLAIKEGRLPAPVSARRPFVIDDNNRYPAAEAERRPSAIEENHRQLRQLLRENPGQALAGVQVLAQALLDSITQLRKEG